MEKKESFEAKRIQHQKSLEERRGILVQQEASVAQREANVGLVDLNHLKIISSII